MEPIQSEFSLRDVQQIIRRRKGVIITITAICIALSIVACMLKTREYTATSIVEVQKPGGGGLDLSSMTGGAAEASDAISANLDLMTQVNILKSQNIALRVIQDKNLEQTEDFRPHLNVLAPIMGLFKHKEKQDEAGATLDNSPLRMARDYAAFSKHLKVTAVGGTRLIQVQYISSDPKVAAAVADDLVKQLTEFTFQVKFKATSDASQWLEVQLGDLRGQATDLQAKVVAMQKETGLFGVGGTDLQGHPVVYSPTLDQLQQITAELARAEENRFLKGAVYQTASTGNAELLSQLSGTSIGESGQGAPNALNVLQGLRSQESALQAQIQQMSAKYGSAYPKLLESKASLEQVERSIHAEVARIAARAKNDYEISKSAESSARAAYEQARGQAEKLNDKTIEFTIAQREADQSQELYQDLLKHLKEAGVIEGLHSSNLVVVDRARIPAAPSQPRIPAYLGIGLGAGLFLGACGALMMDAVDVRVHGIDEIEAMHYSVLGFLPELKKDEMNSDMIPMRDLPRSAFSEAIRGLRSTLMLARSAAPPKIIAITSAIPGEGKSTVALNLAVSFAQHRVKTLLVDADMRRPTVHSRTDLPRGSGLSEVLSRENISFTAEAVPDVENLSILTAGPTPPYPAELLGSEHFRKFIEYCKKEYDLILIDTPPVLAVVDSREIASYADVVLIVTRPQVTTRPALQRSYQHILQRVKNQATPPIGVVMNAVGTDTVAYYEYYGSKQRYGYYYGYGSDSVGDGESKS